jgi:hypothetical protein
MVAPSIDASKLPLRPPEVYAVGGLRTAVR